MKLKSPGVRKKALFFASVFPVSVLLLFTCSLNTMTNEKLSYNLNKPDLKTELPAELHEVSGISLVNDTLLACVQDELGTVFFYDLKGEKISRRLNFAGAGDYEDITRVDNNLYVLRSDGLLYRISAFDKPDFKVDSFATGIPSKNTEGLCYDSRNNRLLLGCKSKAGKGKEAKDNRTVWAFDIKNYTLSDEPLYHFDLSLLTEYALSKDLPVPANKDGEHKLKMKISALAINPADSMLYILTAAEYLMYVFDKSGKICCMQSLDKNLFKKAEGLTFYSNGDMLISNEGLSGKPDILRFNK